MTTTSSSIDCEIKPFTGLVYKTCRAMVVDEDTLMINDVRFIRERTCTVIDKNLQGLNMIIESCSECANYLPRNAWTGKLLPYCPHCGAKVVSE